MSETSGPPQTQTLRTNLGKAKSFSLLGLLLTLGGSCIGTAVPTFVGEGPTGTLVGTASLSLLTALGLTGADRTATGAKAIITLILSAGAVAVTVSGVTVADTIRGKSLSGETQNTFPVRQDAENPPSTVTTPSITSPPVTTTTVPPDEVNFTISPLTRQCGSTPTGNTTRTSRISPTCSPLTVTNVSEVPLTIGQPHLDGAHKKEFSIAEDNCAHLEIAPAKTCTITIRFAPAKSGERSAQLVIPQILPTEGSAAAKLVGGAKVTPPTSGPVTTPRPTTTTTTTSSSN